MKIIPFPKDSLTHSSRTKAWIHNTNFRVRLNLNWWFISTMDPYYSKPPRPSAKPRRSGTALFSLVLLGCGIVFFAIVMIACSFVINYADDFKTDDDMGIEADVQSGFTYCQYWAGIPVSTLLIIYNRNIWKYCFVSGRVWYK